MAQRRDSIDSVPPQVASSTKVWRFDAGAGLLTKQAAAAAIKLGIDTGATATTMPPAVDLDGYPVR